MFATKYNNVALFVTKRYSYYPFYKYILSFLTLFATLSHLLYLEQMEIYHPFTLYLQPKVDIITLSCTLFATKWQIYYPFTLYLQPLVGILPFHTKLFATNGRYITLSHFTCNQRHITLSHSTCNQRHITLSHSTCNQR